MKIICADRVSVGLSYDANFKWHMPICVERCRVEQKYMPFFGTVTERAFRKKFQNTGTYTNDTTIRSGFVSAKRVRWRSRVLDFFQDSRIRVKYFCRSSWHCIVGKSFGSYVTHQTSHFIYFYLDKFAILLFKSAWASTEQPNWLYKIVHVLYFYNRPRFTSEYFRNFFKNFSFSSSHLNVSL